MVCRAQDIVPPRRLSFDSVHSVTVGAPGTFVGGACRADPEFMDALIDTILIDEHKKVVDPNRSPFSPTSSPPTLTDDPAMDSVIAQSWISELQVAQSQSCGGYLKTGKCWCVVSDSVAVGCTEAATCAQQGWQCNSAQDPDSESQLQALLQQHVAHTLAVWAQTAGFALRYYQRDPAETDSSYKQRLVILLSTCIGMEWLGAGAYDEHGQLSDDIPLSAAYVAQHGCPASMYASTLYGMCLNCPHGKVAAAGATQESDCRISPTSLPDKRDHIPKTPETTGTPFPDCVLTQECELALVDVEQPGDPLAVLVKQPSPAQNRTDSSATWQVYIPSHTDSIA